MTELLAQAIHLADSMVWVGVALTLTLAVAVVGGRAWLAYSLIESQRVERRYEPIVKRALQDDDAARELAACPARDRVAIAFLLVAPILHDRTPALIARVREIIVAMSVVPLIERWLHSGFWWQRARALRGLGLLQMTSHTAAIVAALDDPELEVRAAALDAVADLRDPASLRGLVARLHDQTLPRGRRAAALAAFGSGCEPFLLEMSEIDTANRPNYARALAICGTSLARPVLCRWVEDARIEVRVAALTALGHVGLDERAARLATEALESGHVMVRAKAAFALRHAKDPDNAARLAMHLDDAWPVAALAAQSLQALGDVGIVALQAAASRSGVAAVLARQALWEMSAQC